MDHTHEPGLGHNSKALPLEDQALIAIKTGLEDQEENITKRLASYARAPAVIETEDQAEGVTTLMQQLRTIGGNIDRIHETVKAPYLQAGRVVDGIAGGKRAPLVDAFNDLQERLTAYQSKRQKQIDDERAAERKKLEEMNEPEPVYVAPAPAKRVTTRSAYGAKATLQQEKVFTVTDPKKVPIAILRNPKVLAAIISVARPRMLQGEKVTGIQMDAVDKSKVTT